MTLTFKLGDGCSTISNEHKLSVLTHPPATICEKHKEYEYTLKIIRSASQLRKEIATTLGLGINVNNIGIDIESDLDFETNFNLRDTFYLLRINCSEYSLRCQVNHRPEAATDPVNLLEKEGIEEFYIAYGDSFINTIHYGRALLAIIQVHGSQEELRLNSNVGAKVGVPTGTIPNAEIKGKAQVKSGLQRLKTKDVINIDIRAAGLNTPPSAENIDELENIISELDNLSKDVEPIQQTFDVLSYQLIKNLNKAKIKRLTAKNETAKELLKEITEKWDLAKTYFDSLKFTAYPRGILPIESNIEDSIATRERILLNNKTYDNLLRILGKLKYFATSITRNPFSDLNKFQQDLDNVSSDLAILSKQIPFIAGRHILTIHKLEQKSKCKIIIQPEDIPPSAEYLVYEFSPNYYNRASYIRDQEDKNAFRRISGIEEPSSLPGGALKFAKIHIKQLTGLHRKKYRLGVLNIHYLGFYKTLYEHNGERKSSFYHKVSDIKHGEPIIISIPQIADDCSVIISAMKHVPLIEYNVGKITDQNVLPRDKTSYQVPIEHNALDLKNRRIIAKLHKEIIKEKNEIKSLLKSEINYTKPYSAQDMSRIIIANIFGALHYSVWNSNCIYLLRGTNTDGTFKDETDGINYFIAFTPSPNLENDYNPIDFYLYKDIENEKSPYRWDALTELLPLLTSQSAKSQGKILFTANLENNKIWSVCEAKIIRNITNVDQIIKNDYIIEVIFYRVDKEINEKATEISFQMISKAIERHIKKIEPSSEINIDVRNYTCKLIESDNAIVTSGPLAVEVFTGRILGKKPTEINLSEISVARKMQFNNAINYWKVNDYQLYLFLKENTIPSEQSYPNKPKSQLRQLGWNCFDIAIGMTTCRKELIKFTLANSDNIEFRELLAPEIKHAAALTVASNMINNKNEDQTSEQNKQSTRERAIELLQIFDALTEPEEIKQVEFEIDKLLNSKTDIAETNLRNLFVNTLPKDMAIEELLKIVNDYFNAHEAMKDVVAKCNQSLGKKEGDYYSQQELDELFRNNSEENTNDEASINYILKREKLYTPSEKAFNEYFLKKKIYEEYITKYYGNNGWFAFQRSFKGESNTSMIDIAAKFINANIIIQDNLGNEIYRTKNQAEKKITIDYIDNCHFKSHATPQIQSAVAQGPEDICTIEPSTKNPGDNIKREGDFLYADAITKYTFQKLEEAHCLFGKASSRYKEAKRQMVEGDEHADIDKKLGKIKQKRQAIKNQISSS